MKSIASREELCHFILRRFIDIELSDVPSSKEENDFSIP
jgi:hypothetical protein